MNISTNEYLTRALQMFASLFANETTSSKFSKPDQLDCDAELLRQLPSTTWRDDKYLEHSGLFFGCPLSNDRRQLTKEVLLWCPFGWPTGNYETIVSSRLGNRLLQDESVADALRNFFLLTPNSETIVNGQNVTLDEPVQRGCQLFSRKQLRLVPMPKRVTKKWIESTQVPSMDDCVTIYFDESTMSADELQFALSDHVRVVDARKGGRVAKLIERFQKVDIGPVIWQFVKSATNDKHRTSEATTRPAVDWFMYDSTATNIDRVERTTAPAEQRTEILDLESFAQLETTGDYLAHWTRADRAPFPDQTSLSQYDTLFFGNDSASSPLDTLCRILAQKKLLASGKLIRGGRRVTCFTEVPLSEFDKRRTFRPQLSRWDFELFGIAIRKSAFQKLGGKPVRYIEKAANSETANNPFQVTLSNNSGLDWSQEREWRVLGDLDLRQLSDRDAVVFVPDRDSAEVVTRLSRWPVVIVGGVLKESRSGHN